MTKDVILEWAQVVGEAQRLVLEDTHRQLRAYHVAVMQLVAVANKANAPVEQIQAALEPLAKFGPVPVEEMAHEDTAPIEHDQPDFRREGKPTLVLRTLSDEELLNEREVQ